MDFEIVPVDYSNAQQSAELIMLLNAYASDPMGGGEAIPAEVTSVLPARLKEFPSAFSLIAYADGTPAGLANCFYGFSTFAARKLINIHDLMVQTSFRGKGLSQKLLAAVESIARDNDCCKITLEVLANNTVAKNSYQKFGFESYELNDTAGAAEFWQKKIS